VAGAFAGVAVMAKQNMAPLALALALWWLLVSWRSMLVFVAGVAASLLVIWTAILAVSTSLEAAWFNWFQIPAHQLYDKAMLFSTVDGLDRTLLLYSLPIAALVLRNTRKTERGAGQFLVGLEVRAAPFALWKGAGQRDGSLWRARLRSLPVLLLWTGCWLVPTSVLGRIKAGGNENALSPAIYFFALACLLELSPYLLRSSVGSRPGAPVAVALAILLGTYVAVKLPENIYSVFKASGQSPMQTVYNFSRSHPGQIYFPQFPLTILMAEGRLYDFSWGLSDRRAAGHPVANAQFLGHTPPSTERMALMPWVPYWEKDIYSRCVADSDTHDQALPAFTICRFR
jgi:hypothetical protein